eukprot:CAMPEP_0175997798 /NCGR_PEP_ID=MMETSP0108-20121206/56390_1 /TAXON_ID=195067 ORGANISM="Goniomonas pacifica, Strain CCMP1869" /NCGR_SAMPLE_ID=MMETSP0108 /ASSEMBLY_ACC=CAM_ASM_000204 /LENGTH=50 /DNA_ID=CAMNT_0017330077 /DNA_START=1099 /DNA_END=1251 /DNA_ORIENTATION=+
MLLEERELVTPSPKSCLGEAMQQQYDVLVRPDDRVGGSKVVMKSPCRRDM